MSAKYANIIVDISHEKLDRPFQYRIPDTLKDKVQIGIKVRIPFGMGNRIISGYVIGIVDEPEYDIDKIKSVIEIESQGITIESRLIALAAWIRNNYGSTMNQALKTVLPIKQKMKAKEKKRIYLEVSKEEGQAALLEFQKKHNTARARLLEALLEEGSLDYDLVVNELHITAAVIKALIQKKILSVQATTVYRNPIAEMKESREKDQLNAVQQQVVKDIFTEWESSAPRPCLLHGVTGSGKTQVYMELIDQILLEQKQTILLIPEIALTYQTVKRFYKRFGDQISVMNSRLSLGERYDQFERAKAGKIQIMIGPRSALFTPFSNLGLIIIDEEHENTYKSENTPRYHAREVAIQRAAMENAHVVMGSATPSVDAYFRGLQGEYKIVEMDNRFENRQMPAVTITDLREELKLGNRSILSRLLTEKIQERLVRREQVMLFLNRRGYAGFVSCRSCGYVAKCPHCDVSLSSHNNGKMVCHYCGYEIPALSKCPECESPYIGGFRAGTQQIEDIVKKTFPNAKVLRMDMDTTKEKDGHARILSSFSNEEADILIGTQMIVKGHDFPKVTLVGVIAADLSLNGGDYRASERTFQLLAQAVGRAGRGQVPGEAVIQTYQPQHYSIMAAKDQDYRRFYEEEISYRMLMGYPPVSSMVAIYGSCREDDLLEQGMYYLKQYIEKISPQNGLFVIGPAPAAVSKVNDIYKRVIYLRHEKNEMLTGIKDRLERYIEINSGFLKIFIQFDFNA